VAAADDYPSRAITLVVPYPAGGGNDVFARLVATKLGPQLGTQIVVENRGGGGGSIGTRAVAKAAPDGYTLLIGSGGSITINPTLDPDAGYAAKDFAPIGLIASMPILITAYPTLPVRSVEELIAFAKANPGKMNFGTPNVSSAGYLAAELFRAKTQIDFTVITYKGSGPLTNDLIGGHVEVGFNTITPVLGNIRSGGLRAIAVTSSARTAVLPDVPTVSESGVPGFEAMLHWGLLAPAGTPAAIIQRLNRELRLLLETGDAKTRLVLEGGDAFPSSPEEYGKYIETETAKWAGLIKKLNLKPE
jgi:tripartite-type tricarboxylate transporter receptor subunit TctC